MLRLLFRALVALVAVSTSPLLAQVDSAAEPPNPIVAGAPADPSHPLVQPIDIPSPPDLPGHAVAGDPPISVDPAVPASALLAPNDFHPSELFVNGQWAVQYLTGVLFTPYYFYAGPAGQQVPMNFLMENVRISRIVRSTDASRWLLRGSFELVLELHTMPIIKGPGTIVLGVGYFIRYNFSCTQRKHLILYAQGGGGNVYSDSHLYPGAKLVDRYNWIIHFGIGAHYFLSRRVSLDAEAAYYHYSNGGIVMPNVSVNGANVFFGLTYYFGRR